MKERTKQILRYVACGLGGLALGIGLLGGLSMCATSGNKTNDDVNTIYERTRKNAKETSASGLYDKYTFSVDLNWRDANSTGQAYVYNVDLSTYTLTRDNSIGQLLYNDFMTTRYPLKDVVDLAVASATPTNEGEVNFLVLTGTAPSGGHVLYMSFVKTTTPSLTPLPFIGFNLGNFIQGNVSNTYGVTYTAGNAKYILNTQISDIYLVRQGGELPTTASFQDVPSYYADLGYNKGHTEGYSEGYDDAYAEKDTGIAFTSCGVYPNAQVTLATDQTIGNYKYMYLCHYITKPGYDEHTIYIMWTTNANTGQYLGQVIDRNETDSYDPAVTLGTFTQQATSSVTITATEDMEFGLWVGYITTFHNRGEITNSILWFGGGTSESDLQIYQNGYDEGYQNGNQAGQETGYEEGYDRGHEVGDAEGYSRGYTEGFNQTNTKNVFSLFTSAFDSVASFFDLKIFGFLPLYWFFLAPLFIALISLLMRMVKH